MNEKMKELDYLYQIEDMVKEDLNNPNLTVGLQDFLRTQIKNKIEEINKLERQ